MVTSGILALVVATWLAGPLYGMNVIMVLLVIVNISRNTSRHIARAFILYTSLLFITCTAHSVVSFIQPIVLVTEPVRFESISLPAHTIGLAVYCINISLGQAFIIWRAYAVSGRRIIPLVIFATVVTFGLTALNGVTVWKFSKFVDLVAGVNNIRSLSMSAWITSTVFQGFGSAYIIWKVYAIPVEAHSYGRSVFARNIIPIFLIIVDSGCILPLTELIALIFDIVQLPTYVIVFVSILGQLSAFVPLSIVLRETIKAENDLRKGLVNATSAFLVNRTPTQHRRNSLHFQGGNTSSVPVLVAVEHSEHKQTDTGDEFSMSDECSGNKSGATLVSRPTINLPGGI